MKLDGSCTVLSRPLQDPVNDNWKIIIFSVEESGQLPLIQVNKLTSAVLGQIAISCLHAGLIAIVGTVLQNKKSE